MLKLKQSIAVLALLFSAGTVEAGEVENKEDMPFIILGDPSRSMMGPGREFYSMGAPG